MCGIAGILCLDGTLRQSVNALHQMADCMVKRGPDDEGYLVASHGQEELMAFGGKDTPSYDGSIRFYPSQQITTAYSIAGSAFLGHRRLSIIDLSPHGHQPMCTADGRYWIVYNGEIYNYLEIKKNLKKVGVHFDGHSDTEVLLYAYREWGIEALNCINGMFAFAIWDDKKKELFCARDRIGIKPFYYTIQKEQFIFASDIKTLIASDLYHPEVNLEGLYHAMSFGVAPRPTTSFKGVYALEQGHWLRIDMAGSIQIHRYWRLPVGTQDPSMSENDAEVLLYESLRKAVGLRLVSDVPVGAFMSGGIDSTTISAIASQFHPGIKAFTLAFEDNAEVLDELDQAKATAAMHPLKHIVRIVKPETILDHIQSMVRCYEEPFYALSPNYVISQLVAENGVTVVLNGLGGDELFAGYPYYGWLKKWRLIKRIAPVMGLLRYAGHNWQRLSEIAKAKSADRLHSVFLSNLTENSKQTLFNTSRTKEFDTIERLHQLYVGTDVQFTDDIEAISYMDMMNYIGNHHVYRVDQFTMKFSIESRFPFLDHEVIEAAYRIPSRYKQNGNIQKYVLRKVAEKLIHPSCLKMKKKGFSLPMDQWMRGPLKGLVEENIHKLMQRDLFNPDEVQQRYLKFQAGNLSYKQIWHLVAVELWLDSFINN